MDSSRGVKTLNEESMLIIFFSVIVIVICKYECQVRKLFVAGNNDMDVVA